MKLTKEDAQEIAYTRVGRTYEGKTVLSDEITGQGRWTIDHYTVFRLDADGTLWGFCWDAPATECQEGSECWYDVIDCTPMRAVQVTVTQYEELK